MMRQYDTVPVTYEGGPLDGNRNDVDYILEELEAGQVFDYPTRGTGIGGVGLADTVERYVLQHRPFGGWAFVHTGTFTQPIEKTAFLARVVGGPHDGREVYLLGTARLSLGRPMEHIVRGCVLHHEGDDPVTGWELRYEDGNAGETR